MPRDPAIIITIDKRSRNGKISHPTCTFSLFPISWQICMKICLKKIIIKIPQQRVCVLRYKTKQQRGN